MYIYIYIYIYIMTIKPYILNNLKTLLKDSHKSSPILMAVLSSGLAAIGLATNSGTTILGSMLLSPISSLIVSNNIIDIFKFKNIKFKKKYDKNIFNVLLVIICLSLITSTALGYIFVKIENYYDKTKLFNWPTQEMKDRANPINSIYIIFIALICGLALPFSLIMNNGSKLIAIGIATALTPPLANIGLGISLKLYKFFNKNKLNNNNINDFISNSIMVGGIIFLINMLLLYLPTKLLLKIFATDNNIFKKIEQFFI